MATAESDQSRKGQELEKFKRRMIRSVARKLREKKPNDEMWTDMKKEIGSNCKKLWERMKTLTLKKLKRLLEADDRVDLIGPVARMTLTDWLLFDLVIVHEKIDVIDREKLNGIYQSKVLSNLFSLVQRFDIEKKIGEELADAWTSATLYYNSKGHQCSPMMLQRRWYQIKELTRHKFYKFWFNYRGNQRQLVTAKQDSPDELQKAIALKYPEIITQKFLTWEERIKHGLVIMPDELGVKMRQKELMKASDTSVPDVVLVEPRIEVIDLGTNSDSEDENSGINESENAVSETQTQPTVKIKSEPLDDDNFDIDETYIPPEKGSEFDEEIQRLQMVEEHFDSNELQNLKGSYESVVIDPVPPEDEEDETVNENAIDENDVDPELTSKNDDALTSINPEEVASLSTLEGKITDKIRSDAIVIDDDNEECFEDDALTANDYTNAVISSDEVLVQKDSGMGETINNNQKNDFQVGDTSNDSNIGIAEISSISSVGIKVENVSDVLESGSMLNDEAIAGDAPEELLPVISTVSSAGIKVERDLAVRNDTLDNAMEVDSNEKDVSSPNAVDEGTEILDQSEVLPVISTVSSEFVKMEVGLENSENPVQIDENSSDIVEQSKESLAAGGEPGAESDDLEEFTDIHNMDLNFVGEGIDFADDGIAYIEDDEDDIITINDPPPLTQLMKTEENADRSLEKGDKGQENKEDGSCDEEDEEMDVEKAKSQKFDLKLLMCPVVYTTKLDTMTVFNDNLQYEQVSDKETIDKIYTLSKPVSKLSVNSSEQVMELEETDTSDVNIHQARDENYVTNVSDDDLFRNEIEESSDSDSESKIIESKRVKMTSYMLRKPKHRSYNPVLLCKNPDFNTRLKKISVGFFMSARNRMLLQSCIPITIDMTKAFEDKLVNGTLYLKPTPTDPVIDIQNDKEVNSTTLVEQSLMSIDETLEQELKKRMTERHRAINLPDISQVRRLNQHLLTAEVTPLRLDNQNAAKSSAINYVQNLQNDIHNLISQQKAKDISNAEIDSVIPVEPSPTPLLDNSARIRVVTPPIVSIESPISRVQPAPPIVSTSVGPRSGVHPTSPASISPLSRMQPTRPLVPASVGPLSRMQPTRPLVPASVGPLSRMQPTRPLVPASVGPLSRLQPTPPLVPASVGPLSRMQPTPTLVPASVGPLSKMQPTPPLVPASVGPLSKMQPTPPSVPASVGPLSRMQPTPPLVPIVPASVGSLTRVQPTTSTVPTSVGSRVQPTPPIVSSCIDSPYKRVQSTSPPMVTLNSPIPGFLSSSSSSVTNLTPSTKNANIENQCTVTNLTKTRKPIRKTYYPPLAWNKRHQVPNTANQEQFHADALLTIDTLYKMLSALDPSTSSRFNEFLPKKKSKPKNKFEKIEKKPEKEKVNETIKDNNQVIDITDDEAPVVKLKRGQKPITSVVTTKERKYCCWFSYRVDYLQFKTISKRRHRCKVDMCLCCCQELLQKFEEDAREQLAAKKVEVEHEHEILKTIERVVQTVKQPKIMTDVSIQIDLDENDSQVEPLSDISSSNKAVLSQTVETTQDGLSLNSSDDLAAELTPLLNVPPLPQPKFRVYTGTPPKPNIDPTDKTIINTKIKKAANNKPAVKPLQKPYVFNSFVSSGKACTCRPNISQVNKGVLEINGSSNCPKHKKPIKENKVILSKKLVTDENQPFFVGKGKILLTNVKMPKKKAESLEVVPLKPRPKQLQSISMPAGVQVFLLPDQTVTYIVQPDVTLTPEEYAILPQFLVAIQQQINAVGVTLPANHPVAKTDEIIDLDNDETPNTLENSSAANTESVPHPTEPILSPELDDESTSEEIRATKIDDFEVQIDSIAKDKRTKEQEDFEMRIDILAVEKEKSASVSGDIDKPKTLTDHKSKSNNTGENIENLLSKSTDLKPNEPTSSNAGEATNKKSLLSDLMEMSGIMEEDLAPPPLQPITQEPIMIDTSNFVLQQHVPSEEVVERNTTPEPSLQSMSIETSPGNKNATIELVAITSFAELKYARDNDGLFFKLDLETGHLTSINVCIQKFPSSPQKLNDDKSVIDLTDDPDVSITGATEAVESPASIKVLPNNPKPPNKKQLSSILQKKQRLMDRLSNNLRPINILQSKKYISTILKRNKNFLGDGQFRYYSQTKTKKIEAKIDLVDSDAPMEEEYLVNSDDDSSDDEPLIKKAKRIHSNDTSSPLTELGKNMDKQDEDTKTLPNEQRERSEQDKIILQENSDEQKTDKRQHPEELNTPQNIAEQNQHHTNNEINLDEQDPNEQENEKRDVEVYDEENVDEDIEGLNQSASDEEMDGPSQTASMPVPTNLVLSGGALNAHSIPITIYRPENEASQDDDCILGV